MMPPLESSTKPLRVHATEPRERPILFSAPMVRALLAGTKTQTRRVVALPRSRESFVLEDHGDGWWPYQSDDGESSLCSDGMEHPHASPYGLPGDRLWVRESWMPDPPIDDTWASTEWAGCRDGKIAGVPERFRHPAFCNYAASWLHGDVRWTPSIHMPRWASRILLDVTGLRVERLQDISEADAITEGVERREDSCGDWMHYGDTGLSVDAVGSYRSLWERINGEPSWRANPWVWVVEFRRITP